MHTTATRQILAESADDLLHHTCSAIPNSLLTKPGPEHLESVFGQSNRSHAVKSSLFRLYGHGRLAGSGYVSIFPVDQGLEHTAAYSFYENPRFFDPKSILDLAVEGGCSGVATSIGALALFSKSYAEKIPFIVKINHSEHLTLPEKTDQLLFSSVKQAHQLGAVGIGATIYFGSPESHRQIEQIAQAIEAAHELGMLAVIWCYPRNENYVKDSHDYSESVDITAQALHIAVSMGADIVKQKMPQPSHGFEQLRFSKSKPEMYKALVTDHPIDLVRYQVLHAFSGRIGLLNSGGESHPGQNLKDAVTQAVINKRAGGQGIIMGRKVFKQSWEDGLKLLWAVQDVYLDDSITLA